MPTPSPYRAPPRPDDAPRALSFFPQLRPWLIPFVMVLGPAAIYATSIEVDTAVQQSSVSCEVTAHGQGNWNAQSGIPQWKRGEEPVASTCWTCDGKCTNRGRRDSLDRGEFKEPWRPVDCAAAREELVEFGNANPKTSVIVLSPAAGNVPHAEVLARFDRCVAANGKTLGTLPEKTSTITAGLFDSPRGKFQALAALAALFALVMCLPTRRVRATVDRQSRTIRIREQGLFQRAALQEVSIDELLDVVLEGVPGANTEHIIMRRTQGSPVRLFASDLRPIELKRRTAKRLGAWLAAARARD